MFQKFPGRPSFTGMWPGQSHRPVQRGLCSVYCSAVFVLKFLLSFEQGALLLLVALGTTGHVTGPVQVSQQ